MYTVHILRSIAGEIQPGTQQGTAQATDGARGGVACGVGDGVGIGISGAPGGAVQSVSNADVLFVNPQLPRSPLGGGGGPAGTDEPPVLHLARNSRLTLKEEREAADRLLRVQNTVRVSYDSFYSSAIYAFYYIVSIRDFIAEFLLIRRVRTVLVRGVQYLFLENAAVRYN